MTSTILITGGNRGIGLGLVRQYLKDGWQVQVTARNESSELTALAESHGTQLTIHKLDVTDHAAIDKLAGKIEDGALDVLINNAGVYTELENFGAIDFDAWRRVLEVNTLAPAKVAEALAGKIKNGGTLAFISSLIGSIGEASGQSYIYGTSKAALNMVAKLLSVSLKKQKIRVVTLHPGSVMTDMNPSGHVSVVDSAAGLAKVIDGLKTSGHFYDFTGKELPW